MPSMAQLEDANRRLQHEIGERERAEGALRDVNAQLEQRVAARTAELEGEVAQRRRAEETLRASEERWRSMFETVVLARAICSEMSFCDIALASSRPRRAASRSCHVSWSPSAMSEVAMPLATSPALYPPMPSAST